MNHSLHKLISRQRIVTGAFALITAIALSAPQQAMANSTAETTIINKASVSYTDAAASATFYASASATVTVNLVKAPLNASGAPISTDGSPSLVCNDVTTNYASGDTVEFLYALTATANGDDTYKLSMGFTDNATDSTVVYKTLTATGALAATDPATRLLGSAIPISVTNDNQLNFPGGALTNAGFEAGDIVLVPMAGVGAKPKVFIVTTVFEGIPASAIVSATTAGSITNDTLGYLILEGYDDATISINGSNVTVGGGADGANDPAFSTVAPLLDGSPVGEMVLIKVEVTATTTTPGTDGTVDFSLTIKDSDDGNVETAACKAGTFKAANLTITKQVRNVTADPSSSFTATASGNPTDILEYQLTINNAGAIAKSVVVTDNVPEYTTLVAGAFNSGNAFAVISAGNNNVNSTPADDAEVQPLFLTVGVETGFGDTGGAITAGTPITFYLGDDSDKDTGGVIPYCTDGASDNSVACATATADWITSYTIIYQVKID